MSSVARVRNWRGEAAVTLVCGLLEATFLPDLGMLGASLRHDGDELLALPAGLAGYRASHQSGLPLLAPWANRLDRHRYEITGRTVDLAGLGLSTDPNGLPIHGTMTAQRGWDVVRLEAATVSVRFDYGAHPALLAAFPFPHEIIVEARLDERSLSVTTTVRPSTDLAVPVAFGWHPYLRLPRSPRRSWRLVLPDRDHLELDGRGLPTGRSTPEPAEARPIGDRTFDDLYALGEGRVLALETAKRRLAVSYGEGYPYAQVFAPTAAGFACLEPMTVSTNALGRGDCPLVMPGEEFSATFSITATG